MSVMIIYHEKAIDWVPRPLGGEQGLVRLFREFEFPARRLKI